MPGLAQPVHLNNSRRVHQQLDAAQCCSNAAACGGPYVTGSVTHSQLDATALHALQNEAGTVKSDAERSDLPTAAESTEGNNIVFAACN